MHTMWPGPFRLRALLRRTAVALAEAVRAFTRAGLILIGLLGAACGGPQPPPFNAVVDNRILMQSVIDPQSWIIWNSVKTIVSDKEEEIQPTTDEEWDAVRHASVNLAEAGNLLMMVPRAKDGGDWMTFSRSMSDKAVELMHAAEQRDPQKVFTLGGDLYETCTTCHQKYIPEIANALKSTQ
jgi:hypothetical protein